MSYNPDDFVVAVKEGNVEIAKKCLELGIDSNTWNNDRWSVLHLAAQNGHSDIVNLLCEHKADVNYANKFNGRYETPLHIAARYNQIEICKLLIKYGANINCQTSYQETPLAIAASKNNFELCQELVKSGADLNIKTIDGKYPIDYAYGRVKEFLLMFQNNQEKDKKVKGKEGKEKGKEKEENETEEEEIPSNILCGLTNEIMTDPVDLSDGNTYERSVIEEWLQSNDISPITGQILIDKTIIPNQSIKLLCQKWKK